MLPKSFDVVGNIAILKFDDKVKKNEKIKIAKAMLKKHNSIKTVLEKSDRVKGRLRKIKTNYLAGTKTKEAFYRENNCLFKLNIDKTYFSPRLSNERKEIAQQVKKDEVVLVMFAGVAPFSIVIAKLSKPKKVYSVEINRTASKYAEENAKLNKLNNVEVISGDVKKVIPKFAKNKLKFDRIVMPRAQLKETFLKQAFQVIKKNGTINYYGFGREKDKILEEIKEQVKKSKKKIKIIKVKKAGEIAPYKFRWRVDFKIV